MKYLNTYKTFESVGGKVNQYEVKEHILDICSPIIDEGFHVEVMFDLLDPTFGVTGNRDSNIFISVKKPAIYHYEEVSDELRHIARYLKDEGFDDISISYYYIPWGISGTHKNTTSNLSDLEGEEISQSIGITFKKSKITESLQDKDLTNDIEDILIDLKDDGCAIDVKYYPGYGNTTFLRGDEDFRYSYSVLISNYQEISKEFGANAQYDVDAIEPKIDQLHSYMTDEGYPHMRRDKNGHHTFLFFGKNNYNTHLPNRSGYVRIKEAKKLDPETNFKGIIDDVLTDAIDRGFRYHVDSFKSTHYIKITFRSKTELDQTPTGLDHPVTIFKWKEIKDDISMLVNYLSDTYPKITFNEFLASLKFRKGPSTKREYYSVRSILKSTERGIKSYNLKDFMSELEDDDILESINIQCLVRFRGK